MSTQSDLAWRYAWRQGVALLLLLGIGVPFFWGIGWIKESTLIPFVGGMLLAAGSVSLFGMRVTASEARALDELQAALERIERLEQRGSDEPLSSDCHVVLPDIAASLERAQVAIRRHADSLAGERDRLLNVINSMAEGVIGVDGQQRIVLVNTAACRILGLREDSTQGRPVWEQVRSQQLQTWVAEAVEKSSQHVGDLQVRSAAGRDLALSVAGIKGPALTGAVIVITDVTELRRLEKVRQQFVANASHELKSPITSIQACIETLIDGAVDDPECRDRFLQTICEQTERLDLLVKDLLTLARLESEPVILEPRPVWVEGVMRLCYERHLQKAQRKGLTLVLQPVSPELQVLAEEDALEHILDNLIDNSVKYTDPGGTVTLSLQVNGKHAVIEVKDSGIGIPQHHLVRIFERFYRVDRHRSREVGGTGLGLSIVKHLVQAIGGSVSVASRLHEGSTFSIQLPLATRPVEVAS